MFWPLVIIGTALVVGLYIWLELRESTQGKVARILTCPESSRDVEVLFRSDYLDVHHYQGVESCSAFCPGEPVSCHRSCLQLTKPQIDFRLSEAPY
jgi:hypothetical protein